VIISRTPLRISFAGGGTDFPDYFREHGGAVISTAIDKYIYVMVNPSFDGKIRVNYSKHEVCDRVQDVKHDLVREAMIQAGVKSGVEISTMADIPSEGSGLGSSSALMVGLLNALTCYNGLQPGAEELAHAACFAEVVRLEAPIGYQDQYIAAFGGLQLFHFRGQSQVLVSSVAMSPVKRDRLEAELMLFFTGITRSASTILAEQKQNIPARIDILKQLGEQVLPMKAFMTDGPRQKVGQLLHQSWQLKQQLAQAITTPEIDAIYEKALKAGATGGKLSGAGGGGFLLLHCPVEKQDSVRFALSDLQEMPFQFESRGSQIILDEGERYVCES
jgi:D-glycero-alpha-D-manno-heptose-7-phosphate kinase